MKRRKSIPNVLGLGALAATALLVVLPALGVERLGYILIESFPQFELRQYEDHLLATTTIEGDFERAGNKAFRPLFNYIDGKNSASRSIPMTAPVTQTLTEAGYAVSFVMPSDLAAESLPAPISEAVALVKRTGLLMAGRTYRGGWGEERYLQEQATLREALRAAGFVVCGPSTWARFDPPFVPSFWRTNEILIPVSRSLCTSPSSQVL